MAYTPFKMKGHTLPGINQKSEGDTDTPDGRSGSSAFQKKSPAKMDKAIKGGEMSEEEQIALSEQQFGEGVEVKQSQHQTARDRLAKQAYSSISTPQTGGTIHDASQGVRSKAYKHADDYLAKKNKT